MDLVHGEGYVQHLRALSRALQRQRHIVIRRVEEDGDARQSENRLFQQLQPLRLKLGSTRGASCDVRARMCQIRHDTAAEGVADSAHHDGYSWVVCFAASAASVPQVSMTST